MVALCFEQTSEHELQVVVINAYVAGDPWQFKCEARKISATLKPKTAWGDICCFKNGHKNESEFYLMKMM